MVDRNLRMRDSGRSRMVLKGAVRYMMGQWIGRRGCLLWSSEAAEILAEIPRAPMTSPGQAGATETR